MRPSGRRWLVRTSEAATGAVACSGRTSGSDTSENVADRLPLAALEDLEVAGGQAGHDAAVLVGHDHVDDRPDRRTRAAPASSAAAAAARASGASSRTTAPASDDARRASCGRVLMGSAPDRRTAPRAPPARRRPSACASTRSGSAGRQRLQRQIDGVRERLAGTDAGRWPSAAGTAARRRPAAVADDRGQLDVARRVERRRRPASA